MKKILVPTDFSKTSHNAFLYAREMAKELGAAIKVVHLYNGTFQPNQPYVLKAGMGRKETLESHLNEFVYDALEENGGGITAKTKIMAEAISALNMTNALVNLTKDPEVLMVIMGTTGEHDVLEKIVGSFSTTIAQKAYCPVLMIPKGKKFEPFKSILFASNFESADDEMLEDIMYFANIFRSTLHFIHVKEKNDNYEKVSEDVIFEKIFEKGDPAFAFNMATIESDSVVKGLNQYAEENHIDLVVLVNRDRDFISTLMRKSITQRMGLYTQLPMMVFHILR